MFGCFTCWVCIIFFKWAAVLICITVLFQLSEWLNWQALGHIVFVGRNITEPAHDKTYNYTCVTSKDSDQPVHPPSLTRVLFYPSLDSPEAVEDTWDQRRLWADCVDAQADLSLRWSHKSFRRFYHALVRMLFQFSTHPSHNGWGGLIKQNVLTLSIGVYWP